MKKKWVWDPEDLHLSVVSDSTKPPDPRPFYLKKIVVWAPHITFSLTDIRCFCDNSGCFLRAKEWASNPPYRLVIEMDNRSALISYAYKGSVCGDKVYGSTHSFLSRVPPSVQAVFPYMLTVKLGINIEVFTRCIFLLKLLGWENIIRQH